MSNFETAASLNACRACADSCIACADECREENNPQELAVCIRLEEDCASVCIALGEVLERRTEPNAALLGACITACNECARECDKHASMTHCAECRDSCRTCQEICEDLQAGAYATA